MGNSNSNTVKPTETVPLKPALKKHVVLGPVNGYKYYPTSYAPAQHAYPLYPPNYPVDYNQNYPQNQFYPQLQPTNVPNKIPEQQRIPSQHQHPSSTSNYPQDTPYDYHRHRHHRQHTLHGRHHHHHHHHHRPRLSFDKEHLNSSITEEHDTSPHQPSPQTQIPISSVSNYKGVSPIVNNELEASSPAHHSSSVTIKKTSTPVVVEHSLSPVLVKRSVTPVPTGKPPSSILIKQHQTPQPTVSKSTSSSVVVPSRSFEKVPPIKINYVAKSSDNHSIHNYTSGPLTVVRSSSSQYTKPGNRWYDHDYDKRVQSLATVDV